MMQAFLAAAATDAHGPARAAAQEALVKLPVQASLLAIMLTPGRDSAGEPCSG